MSPDYMRSSRERYGNPRALIASSRSVAFQEAGPFGSSGAGGKKNGVSRRALAIWRIGVQTA
jgi:hypothetical protein